eukprot:GHRR01017572.1.p1 GENE.GHRR01017572.1~~GHRR01017572.1.p1  ORF type:complete len:557 (+),score=138.61 GHRR01017572.1:190-1671(+)
MLDAIVCLQGSLLYHAYWESSSQDIPADQRPILLWLQGGPGCSSTFGAFYELGPFLATGTGSMQPNPGAWNRLYGLLVIDQPIGTGYSIAAATEAIPSDMLGAAQDLYWGLYGFFKAHEDLQHRPFFITGESYGGKYVPSIAHYILQAESDSQRGSLQHRSCRTKAAAARAVTAQEQLQPHRYPYKRQHWQRQQEMGIAQLAKHGKMVSLQNWWQQQDKQQRQRQPDTGDCTLRHPRLIGSTMPPNFNLTGIAIGNGLTDPISQTRVLPRVMFSMGLVTEADRKKLQDQGEEIIQLVQQQAWLQAVQEREQFIQNAETMAGVATLFDVRRNEIYDAKQKAQNLLNRPDVKAWMQADASVNYTGCSDTVMQVMAADTMKSAKHLVEDILRSLPVLLYQGQFDGQDGVASNNAWIAALDWDYSRDFEALKGEVWLADGVPAGWQRNVSTLTQVVIRNAGHMVPHDQPHAAQQMIETWLSTVLTTPEEGSVLAKQT